MPESLVDTTSLRLPPELALVALKLEAFCPEVDDAVGGSSSKAQVEHDFCSPRGRKPVERKVTGDGIPEFSHLPLTRSLTNRSPSMRPSVDELSRDLLRRSAPLTSARSLGLAQAERDLPYTDDESMLNRFPCRQQSCQGFRHRSMAVGSVCFKGVRKRKGIRGYLVEIRPPKWKKTIWLGTYNTEEEAGGAYDAGIFYTGKRTKYNFPELPGTFPPLPSPLQFESADDADEIKAFVQQQAREAARLVKNIRMKGECTNLCKKEMKICIIETEAEPPDVAATTTGMSRGSWSDSNEAAQFFFPPDCQTLCELCESVGEDRSEGFQWAPHVEAVPHSRDLQPECTSMRSCDAIDEDGLMLRLAPSIRKQVEDEIKLNRSVPINDDDLMSRLAPSIRKEVEGALSSTLRPLVCALRSREEDEQKHREKLLALETQKLALETQKLALKRAKLLLEQQRVARCQPHSRTSSHSGNRVKKYPTAR